MVYQAAGTRSMPGAMYTPIEKAAQQRRTPKPGGEFDARYALAFWSAAVLRRFSTGAKLQSPVTTRLPRSRVRDDPDSLARSFAPRPDPHSHACPASFFQRHATLVRQPQS